MEEAAPPNRPRRVSTKRASTPSGGVPGWALLILTAIGIYAWRKYEVNKTSTTATNGADTVGAAVATDAAADLAATYRGSSSPSDREWGHAAASVRSGFAGRAGTFAGQLALVALLSVPSATAGQAVRVATARHTVPAATARHTVPAIAARRSSHAAALRSTVWAVDVTPSLASKLTPATIASWRARGINSVVLETKLLGKRAAARAAALAIRGNLRVIGLDGSHGACHVVLVGSTCATTATSALHALRLARTHGRDTVVAVHLSEPSSVRFLRTTRKSGARVLAILPLSVHTSSGAAWQKAIAITATTPTLGLAIHQQTTMSGFLALLSSSSSAPASVSPAAAGTAPPTATGKPATPTPQPGSSGGSGNASASVPSGVVCYGTRSVSPKVVKATFAAAVCAAGVGTAVTVSGLPGSPSPQSTAPTTNAGGDSNANIWVSTTGNDSSCTRSASPIADSGGGADCASFNGASSIAHAGDTILVGCGSYDTQTINTAPDAAPAIVFAPATPGCVTANGLNIEASYVTVENLTNTGYFDIGNSTCLNGGALSNVSLIGGSARRFYITDVANFLISGVDFGPLVNDQNYMNGCPLTTGIDNSGVFTNNTIHDLLQSDPSVHASAIYMDGENNGVTISNNKIENSTQADLSLDVGPICNPAVYSNCRPWRGNKNILIKNNVFDTPCSHASDFPVDDAACGPQGTIRVVSCSRSFTSVINDQQNITIINNTLYSGITVNGGDWGPGCSNAGNVFANNIVNGASPSDCTRPGYGGDFSYSYNVWGSDTACGTGSVTDATINFADPRSYDFRLVGRNTACDFVPTSQAFPPTDLTGATRP